jgi:hypothetical protein
MQQYSVVVAFSPTTYTVTEGVDEFAELVIVRSGDLSRNTTVTVTTFDASALCKLQRNAIEKSNDIYVFQLSSWIRLLFYNGGDYIPTWRNKESN